MSVGIDPILVLICAAFLCAASAQDLRTREIDDKIWVAMGALAAARWALGLFAEPELVFLRTMSTGVSAALFFVLWYLGMYGGADLKALLCISLAFPVPPRLYAYAAPKALPLFPLSVFNNAVLISLAFVPLNLVHNLLVYLREGELFSGYSEPLWRKTVTLVAARKVTLGRVRAGHDLMLSERSGEDGKKVVLWPREDITLEGADDELVFAHYLIPMIVPITFGFLVAAFLGDVLMGFVFGLISS